MKKRLFSLLLVLCLCTSLIPTTAFATNNSQSEALEWVQSLVGTDVDYDGVVGAQCVDLIMAYYDYLGVEPSRVNAFEYETTSLPSGWTRVKGGVPQPGDILIYSVNSDSPNGHVAIYESETVTYHQNFNNEMWVHKVTNCRYDGLTTPYWGYIRPNFSKNNSLNDTPTAVDCMIIYDANGGFSAPAPEITIPGNAISLSLSIPMRDGYKFRGWSPDKTAAAAHYQPGASFFANSDTILYAVWELEVMPWSNGDAPSSWAEADISAAIYAGIVPAHLQQHYKVPVFRKDVAEMFINLIEMTSGKSIDAILTEKGVSRNPSAFTDTDDSNVLAANALGIIQGVGNNKFDPYGNFTRAQIAAIINRVAGVLDYNTEGYSHSFTDVNGHWCSKELGWPVYATIIQGVGDNKFSPDTKLTTEQAIAITYRAYSFMN